MKVLIQVGRLGISVIDHLISPIACANNVQKVMVFSHFPGPAIPKVEYRCPPRFLAKSALAAVIYEFNDIFFQALINKSAYVAGFLLNPHGLIAFVTAKLTRRKVIISLIAGRAELYTKGSVQGIDFNTTIPPWQGRLFLRMLKHSHRIVTTGSVTKLFLVKQGINPEKIYPIISPANKFKFYPTQNPKIYDVVSVGNLWMIKHNETLLYAIAEIKKKRPNIKACIVGDGFRKHELMQLTNELEIKDNVVFVGSQKDVSLYYNSSRIFLHTSEREGFPNVVLEAMECGLPCIVSNCGDIVDIAKDGFNSLVIQQFNDYESFAKAITNLLEDKELYCHLSKNALMTMKLLSVEEVTRKWEMILADCLDRSNTFEPASK